MSEREDDIAWIEGRERGEVSDHPRAALYARLGQAIAALPEQSSGSDAWRAAVLDEVDRASDEQRRARAARVRRNAIVAVALSAGLAAAVVVMAGPGAAPAIGSNLAFTVGETDGARRSTGAVAIGQRLTIRASFAGAGELWIYRGDRLVLRCPGGDGCSAQVIRGGRALEALVRTDVALTYTALLVEGEVAAPVGPLAADVDRAAGAIRETLTIDVQ